jgi:hypothetical protein
LIYKELANILGAACVKTCANEKPTMSAIVKKMATRKTQLERSWSAQKTGKK